MVSRVVSHWQPVAIRVLGIGPAPAGKYLGQAFDIVVGISVGRRYGRIGAILFELSEANGK